MEAESKRDIRTSKVSVATFLPKTLFANASTARSPRPRRLSTGELTGPPPNPVSNELTLFTVVDKSPLLVCI
jgi:hypothetical protein